VIKLVNRDDKKRRLEFNIGKYKKNYEETIVESKSQAWALAPQKKSQAPIRTDQVKRGTWTAHPNIDMCGQGDAEIIGEWQSKHSIKDLKNICEKKGYSAFSISPNSESFRHAGLKKFPYQLTPKHCKPQGYKVTIYIYTK